MHLRVHRNRKESKRDSAPFLKTPLLTLQNSGLPSKKKIATIPVNNFLWGFERGDQKPTIFLPLCRMWQTWQEMRCTITPLLNILNTNAAQPVSKIPFFYKDNCSQRQTEAASFSLPYNMFPNAEWRSNTLDVSQWRVIWQGLKKYGNIQKIPFASILESLSVKLLPGTEDLLPFPHGSITLQTSYISWFLCSLH